MKITFEENPKLSKDIRFPALVAHKTNHAKFLIFNRSYPSGTYDMLYVGDNISMGGTYYKDQIINIDDYELIPGKVILENE